MDLDPPLPRGNLFLSRSFARRERERERDKEMDKHDHLDLKGAFFLLGGGTAS